MPCGQNTPAPSLRDIRAPRPPVVVAPEVHKWSGLLPCLYRGDQTKGCVECQDKTQFECTLLDMPCVIGAISGNESKVASCVRCEHRTKDLRGDAEVTAVLDQLRSGRSSWQPGYWLARKNANARRALKQFIDDAAGEAKAAQCPEFTGRGIVVLGGGEKYFTAAYVCVSLLRKLGCKLPVEWWYLGKDEMDFAMRSIAGALPGVELIDMEERCPDRRRKGGWEAKIHAIMGSKFAEVLFLDADQIPVTNPEFLFETVEYKAAGAMLWPDHLPRGWDCEREAFEVFGLAVPGTEQYPTLGKPTDYDPIESGQMLFDKTRCWPALTMTRWINEHSEIFFPGQSKPEFWYGDKEASYFGFRAVGHEYALAPPAGWIGSDKGGAFLQHAPDGRLVFQHRVQPVRKLQLHGDNWHPPGFQRTAEIEAALTELRQQWSGSLYGWENMGPQDQAVAKSQVKRWLRRKGEAVSEVVLRFGGAFNDKSDSRWAINHDRQTPFLAIVEGGEAHLFGKEGSAWVRDGESLLPLNRSLTSFSSDGDVGFILAEQAENVYKLPDSLEGITVVDVGAHIGAFTLAAIDRGAARVLAIEPDPTNYGHLLKNCAEYLGERVLAFNVAAWSSSGVLPFARRVGAQHSGGGSVVVDNGERLVLALHIGALLNTAGVTDAASVDSGAWLKLDSEGAEYEILKRVDLGRFQAVSLEWHANSTDRARGADPLALAQLLEKSGFEVTTDKPLEADLGLMFARRIREPEYLHFDPKDVMLLGQE